MGILVAECRKFNDMFRRCDIDAEVGCSRFLFRHKAFIRYPDGTVNRYNGSSEIRLALYLLEEVRYLIRQNDYELERRRSRLIADIHSALCDQDREKPEERSQQCLNA